MEKTLKAIWFAACLGALACCVYLVFRPASVTIVSDGKAVQTTQKFGGTTGLDSLSLQGNLSVAGTAALTGDVSTAGALSITGTSTFSGEVSGVPKSLSLTMSSSATTTACSVLNNSGFTRVIAGATVVDRGSAASLGAVTWNAGTSTGNGANGSSAVSYTKVINTIATRVSGVDALTTTSTLLGSSGAYSTWENGSYFNFVSGSTTNSGSCKLLYF